MFTREQVVDIMCASGAAPDDPLPRSYPEHVEVFYRVFSAAFEAGAKAENEACAITAWNHYADECKRSGLNAYHFGDWCAATAIRKRRK